MAWKLCLNYDFTYNKWVWWLEKCKTRTHTRSLENVWRKHWRRALRMSTETNGEKTSHIHAHGDGAAERDDRQQERNGKMNRTKENRCMWLNYLLFARCVFVIMFLSLIHSYVHLHLHTLAYTYVTYTCGASRNRFRFFICSPDAVQFQHVFLVFSVHSSLYSSSAACYSISSTKIMVRIKTSIKSESATMWEE